MFFHVFNRVISVDTMIEGDLSFHDFSFLNPESWTLECYADLKANDADFRIVFGVWNVDVLVNAEGDIAVIVKVGLLKHVFFCLEESDDELFCRFFSKCCLDADGKAWS